VKYKKMLSKVTVMWCLLVTRWVCVDAVTLAVENYSFGAYIFNLLPSTSDSMFARQSRRWTVGCSFRLMTLWYESVFLYLPICKKYGIEHKQNLLLTNFSLLLWHMKNLVPGFLGQLRISIFLNIWLSYQNFDCVVFHTL